jgi:hypothetical protein
VYLTNEGPQDLTGDTLHDIPPRNYNRYSSQRVYAQWNIHEGAATVYVASVPRLRDAYVDAYVVAKQDMGRAVTVTVNGVTYRGAAIRDEQGYGASVAAQTTRGTLFVAVTAMPEAGYAGALRRVLEGIELKNR